MTTRRPSIRLVQFLIGVAFVWLLGFGSYAALDAWRTAGRIYVIDDTGARAISIATYEQRKNDRDLAGAVPKTTPEGVLYVVSNVSLPKFKTDTKRHLRMVRFNHEEQSWFRLANLMAWAAAPLTLLLLGLGASRLWMRLTAK